MHFADIFISPSVKLALVASGLFLILGLMTGVWKFLMIIQTTSRAAPYYVNIAHRASLMYGFASLQLAVMAAFSSFAEMTNILAVLGPLIFFLLAVGSYIYQGINNKTDNQFKHNDHRIFMWLLIGFELVGVLVLFIGMLLTFLVAP